MKKQTFFYTIFLMLALIFTYGCSQLKTYSENKIAKLYPPESTVIKYHSNWSAKHYPKRIKEFKEAPLNVGDIVFIGNSITENGEDWSAKFGVDNIRNRGIKGDVTDGVLKRLDEIIYFKPKAVFILIGINDLYNLHQKQEIPSPEYVGNNILKIAKTINKGTPNIKIYIRTLLPTRNESMISDIQAVNTIIKQNEKNGYYKVIDLHSEFTDEEGLLINDFAIDNTHLNEKGYAHWVELEKNILLKVEKT